ncbi:hypothetical protein HAX54_039743 [Datura stramonium]|uniref:Uncharacterized protein n=1 Tax=Datura stramonium TaxID=4076 RepID=A0ABS8VQE4_DATST|nr:hypothetical protein [Datura stramonium]
MDDDIFEWEMEIEVVGEMMADFFLKGEELEEEFKSSQRLIWRSAAAKRELPVSFRSQPVYLEVALTSASHPVKCRSFTDSVSRNSRRPLIYMGVHRYFVDPHPPFADDSPVSAGTLILLT